MWKYYEICCVSITVYIKGKKKKGNGRLKKKKGQVPHENFTVDEQWFNTEYTVLNHCSGIAAFWKYCEICCVSITVYRKKKKSLMKISL